MNMKILILLALMMTGCETVYHHNTVYQVDYVGFDATSEDTSADVYDANDTTEHCDNRAECSAAW